MTPTQPCCADATGMPVPCNHVVPSTAAGRALFTDIEPMDMWESDGVTPEDICKVEAEAVATERARLAEAVRGLVLKDEGFDEHDRWVTTGTVCGHVEGECGFRAAVLRLLEVEGS